MKLSMYNTDTKDNLEMTPLLAVQSVNGASSTVHHCEHYYHSYFSIV